VVDTERGTRRARRLAFAAAAAVVVGLDQLTKHLAVTGLDDGPVGLVGSVRLALTFNDGAAFNLGSGRTSGIAVVALAIAVILVVLGLRAPRPGVAVGYGVVLGGAAGNLVDRALRAGDGFLGGRVVDFVDLGFWPVFNLADAALWVGIAILVGTSVRDERRGSGAGAPRPDPEHAA
jgi:signal peptidase II